MSYNNLTYLKGVGEKRAQLFEKLGVFDINALFYYYPRSYTDLSAPVSPADAPLNAPCAVIAEVVTPAVEHRIRKGMTLYKFTASNDGTALFVTLFNQKFVAEKIKVGQTYIFYGNVSGNLYNKEMSSPEIFTADMTYIRPTYPACEGLPSSAIEKVVKNALSCGYFPDDPIPQDICKQYNLMPLKEAIKNIHFPQSQEQLNGARRRLMFQELLLLQCGICYMNQRNTNAVASPVKDYSEEFEKLLPFPLTEAQKRSIHEAIKDMRSGRPMNRLLQGDVGSGKTAVAASLCYSTVKSGFQAALMSPTEILAEQHYQSFKKMFDSTGIRVAVITGATKGKDKLYAAIKDGQYDIVIGTHALIQDVVEFDRLHLVITDEQHRFGVEQRKKLIQKSTSPNTLVMSATPIPRTLALMIYGDLDISVLDELPPGRQPIQTRWVKSEKKPIVFDFLKKLLDKGKQAYIVCPLVEENDSDLTPATEYCKQLRDGFLKGYNVGLLHGKMKSAEKEKIMQSFSKGECNVLVSTTVIEVGVDVPNATMMIVENAERFGLSQLHQLRGRVGRGQSKSYCVLISDAQAEVSTGRLNIMCETTDGFKIAEYDLKSRGPGDFFGRRQHGLPNIKLADFINDYKAVAFAQQIAKQICEDDPTLAHPGHVNLKKEVLRLFESTNSVFN